MATIVMQRAERMVRIATDRGPIASKTRQRRWRASRPPTRRHATPLVIASYRPLTPTCHPARSRRIHPCL